MYYKVLWTWWSFGEWPWINMLRVCLILEGFDLPRFKIDIIGHLTPREHWKKWSLQKNPQIFLEVSLIVTFLSWGNIRNVTRNPNKILEKLQTSTDVLLVSQVGWIPLVPHHPRGCASWRWRVVNQRSWYYPVKQLMKQTDLMKTSSLYMYIIVYIYIYVIIYIMYIYEFIAILMRSGFGSFLLMLNFGFSKPMSWSESPHKSDLTLPLKARYHHQFISCRYTSTILPTPESLVIQFCIHLCRLIEHRPHHWVITEFSCFGISLPSGSIVSKRKPRV